jgi:CRISPR-associated protein Cmr2
MTYLLAVSVGPVQDFIAAARRTRDLWFGSWLLSEISKAVAASLAGRGATLIFPPPEADLQSGSEFTVVNKLLAVIDSEDMPGVAADLKRAAKDRLEAELAVAQRNLTRRGLAIDTATAKEQLRGLLEVYCAWTPYDQDRYRKCRERVGELSAARKNLRDVGKYSGRAGVPKSSLDGARESVIREPRPPKLWETSIKRDEYLDAVGVLKRFGGEQPPKFESTLDVAGVPYALRVKAQCPDLYAQYVELVGSEDNRALLYEHESRQVLGDPGEKSAELAAKLKALRQRLPKPAPPYYGLLLGDGDKMGEAISNIGSLPEHQRLSERLSEFATRANTIISNLGGCPVYTGGDDVMALLPLHTALECSRQVNKAFREAMTDYRCTFSAGLAVAHALEPLSEVREVARRAEKQAKNEGGRDALAVIVSPRSGAKVGALGKWDEFVPLLTQILDLYQADRLSAGVAYELRALARRTGKRTNFVLDDVLPKMAAAIAEKKRCRAELEPLLQDRDTRGKLEALVDTMLVARPLARSMKEASSRG